MTESKGTVKSREDPEHLKWYSATVYITANSDAEAQVKLNEALTSSRHLIMSNDEGAKFAHLATDGCSDCRTILERAGL